MCVHGALPSGGLQNAEPELGLRALFLTSEFLGGASWDGCGGRGLAPVTSIFTFQAKVSQMHCFGTQDRTPLGHMMGAGCVPVSLLFSKAVESHDLPGHMGTWGKETVSTVL